MLRILALAVLLAAAAAAAFCFFWPTAAVAREIAVVHDWSLAALDGRRVRLLGSGLLIAALAALLAQVLGAGLTVGLAAARGSRLQAFAAWVALSVLLTPPYLYAYAWSLPLLPGGVASAAPLANPWMAFLATRGRAVWCLGTWLAPVAAAILLGGWRESGRRAYRLALPDASPAAAALRAAAPAMLPYLALSLTAAGLLALTEYSVCHLCLVQTWNSEVLGATQTLAESGRALLLGWPLVAIVALMLAAWWPRRDLLRRLIEQWSETADADVGAGGPAGGAPRGSLIIALFACGVLLLPWLLLGMNLRGFTAFGKTWLEYPYEWPDGLRCAAGSMVVGALLAIAVDYVSAPRPYRRTSIAWSAARVLAGMVLVAAGLFAALPPVLVGDAFAAAYGGSPGVRDSWAIVSLVTAARYAILPMAALRISGAGRGEPLRLAATDRADWTSAYVHVRLRRSAAALLASLSVMGVLSFTEVAATQLVTPPEVRNLAVTLLNKVHFGRQDEVIAMSLYLLALVGLIALALRWRPRRTGGTV